MNCSNMDMKWNEHGLMFSKILSVFLNNGQSWVESEGSQAKQKTIAECRAIDGSTCDEKLDLKFGDATQSNYVLTKKVHWDKLRQLSWDSTYLYLLSPLASQTWFWAVKLWNPGPESLIGLLGWWFFVSGMSRVIEHVLMFHNGLHWSHLRAGRSSNDQLSHPVESI